MTITANQACQLRTLITKRVNAAVEESRKGAGDPHDKAQLEEDLAKAEQKLEEFIDQLKRTDL